MDIVKKYVENIILPLIQYPDDMIVETTTDEMGVLVTLHFNKQDMGLVIGREGESAKALRTIIRNFGMKHKAKVSLKIAEPNGYQTN